MKSKIIALAKKQGAECNIGRNSDGDWFIEVALPNGLIWDNGYNSGLLYQEKYEDESPKVIRTGLLFSESSSSMQDDDDTGTTTEKKIGVYFVMLHQRSATNAGSTR